MGDRFHCSGRLTRDAQISGDFGNRHDMNHNGRVGNTVTVNGHIVEEFPVKRGERVRLLLINAANGRIFGLEFASHKPRIIALDGQPVTPHEPADGRIVLGPAMRADIVLDMTGAPGQRFTVADRFYHSVNRRNELLFNSLILNNKPTQPKSEPPDSPSGGRIFSILHDERIRAFLRGVHLHSSNQPELREAYPHV